MSRTLLLVLCSLAFGCTQATDNANDFELPGLGGKADVSDQVNLKGPIAFGGEASGEFVDDLQYDAYVVAARASAVISTEISRQGSASRLDDVLMVYGPGTPEGGYADAERLVSDDDSGWGKHARITDFVVPEDGNYLLIVGTRDGVGRGHYRLTLQCESGDCAPSAGDLSECDGRIAGYAELCIDARMGDDGLSLERAYADCLDTDTLLEQFIDNCEYSASPPAYCGGGIERFEELMVPACQRGIGFELGLVAGPVNEEPDVFDAWAGPQEIETLRALDGADFDGTDGPRHIRVSAVPDREDALIAPADAHDLALTNPDWEQYLTIEDPYDDFTEWVDVEWEIVDVFEIWADGLVIGFVAQSEAGVSYWDESDPDDPSSADFTGFIMQTVSGHVIAEFYDGP